MSTPASAAAPRPRKHKRSETHGAASSSASSSAHVVMMPSHESWADPLEEPGAAAASAHAMEEAGEEDDSTTPSAVAPVVPAPVEATAATTASVATSGAMYGPFFLVQRASISLAGVSTHQYKAPQMAIPFLPRRGGFVPVMVPTSLPPPPPPPESERRPPRRGGWRHEPGDSEGEEGGEEGVVVEVGDEDALVESEAREAAAGPRPSPPRPQRLQPSPPRGRQAPEATAWDE